MPTARFTPGAFPAVRSLLSPLALAEVLMTSYGLSDVRCRLIKATSRDVYRVESSDGLRVLVVYRHGHRSDAEILAELDLLEWLAAHGVAVAPSLPTLDGARIVSLAAPEGERFAAVFRFVEGRPPGRAAGPDIAHQFGQLVAFVHALTDRWAEASDHRLVRRPIDVAQLVDRPLTSIEQQLDPDPGELADLARAGRIIRRTLAALPNQPPGYGLIHGDVIPTNLMAGPDGALTLLDFDFCGPGWRAYDVATYLRDAQDSHALDSNGRAFLAGYETVRPLVDWERAALPLLGAARGLFRLGNWGPRLNEWGTSARPDGLIARQLAEIQTDLARVC